MDYPHDFPSSSKDIVEKERIRATRDLEQQKKKLPRAYGPTEELETLVRACILRIGITFATEAMKLGWGIARAKKESLSIQQSLAITAPDKLGRDQWGNKIRDLTDSPFSTIKPDVQRKFEESPLWQRFEDILLGDRFENATQGATTESGPPEAHAGLDEQRAPQPEPATDVGTVGDILAPTESAPAETPRSNAEPPASSKESVVPIVLGTQAPKETHKEKTGVRQNKKYVNIDMMLRTIADAVPTNQEEVFRLLDGRKVAVSNRQPFKAAGGWLKGFQKDPHSARAWLSQRWRGLGLPSFARGPKK
jgi:hypothetical protein